MTAKRQVREAMQPAALGGPLGLYIHVPFCLSKCSYCSFASSAGSPQEKEYVSRLAQELAEWGQFLARSPLDTLYMGGGTPSMLSRQSLEAITQAVHGEFETSGLQEATLEANPCSLSPGWLDAAHSGGWSRISLGIQSLDDATLRNLGRRHRASQGLEAIKMCMDAGFRRISADLLLGAPGQDLGRIAEDALSLAGMGLEHLSVYMLDLDKDCPMKSQIESGLLELPPDGQVCDAYMELQKGLPSFGLIQYEISNHSRPGCQSIHNLRYWQRRPYLGLGPSAASQIGNLRWTEAEGVSAWIDGASEPEIQRLSPEESLAEIPLLALRMSEGVAWRDLNALAEAQGLRGLAQRWEEELEPFIARGLLEWQGENLRLTAEGMLLSNSVFRVFV
jgi:oxygen-independent coproporphyrinogen-3 oxidase